MDVQFTQQTSRDSAGILVRATLAKINATASKSISAGRLDITIQPHASSIACETSKITTINVGCPKSRNIRIATLKNSITNKDGAVQDCENAVGSQFVIPGARNTKGIDLTVNSNCASLAHIETSFYSSIWRPKVDLYDGEKWIKTIDSDFFLTEINHRNSFAYNITAGDAGCLIAPQTSSQMKEGWTRDNYRKCYIAQDGVAPITTDERSLQYQIFNATNNLGIRWEGMLDGLYVFKATILDPDFSLCYLTSPAIGVIVYGSPLSPVVQLAIVLGLVASVLLSLAASYIYARSKMDKKAKQE